jgi:hypothetical protein
MPNRNVVAKVCATVVMASVVLVATALPAAAGGNIMRVNAVVNGTPTGSLQVGYTCVNVSASDTSAPFTVTTPQVVADHPMASGSPGQVCTVSVLQDGGMTVSFSCSSAGDGCVDDNTVMRSGSSLDVITVTFDAPAPAPSDGSAAEAIVAAPNTAG